MLLLMWRKDKYYVLHGMTLNWWFTIELRLIRVHLCGWMSIAYSYYCLLITMMNEYNTETSS